MKLFPVLHRTTDWNADDRVQGRADIPLNDQGRAEARELAEQFAGKGIKIIVTSTLRSALETALIMAGRVCQGIWHDPDLVECSFGKLEGLSRAEFNERCGLRNRHDFGDPGAYDFAPFGGEDAQTVLKRQLDVIEQVKRRYAGESVLFVGHGRSLRTLVAGLGYRNVALEHLAERGIDLS